MSIQVKVEDQTFELTQNHKKAMYFLQEHETLEKGEVTITQISADVFKQILKILSDLDYNIPKPPQVKTSDSVAIIGQYLTKLLESKNPKEINALYKAAHYLKIQNLRYSIAAYMACYVYIHPNYDEYIKKKNQIKLDKDLTTEISRKFKDDYPFMN